ncbi:CR2 protein, partial [Promerops cafer]|nr:CR2 protein [Promerops cafer]
RPLSPAVISCPPPPAIPRGQHSGNSSEEFVLGSVTTYTCEPGLELVGQDTLRCTAGSGGTGAWSGAPPACREVTCPRPPSIANGLHSGQSSDRFPRRVTVSYSCKQGFELIGNVSITCTDSGLWSRPLPRCEGAW